MSDSDAYVEFMDDVTDCLERSGEQFRRGDSRKAVVALEDAVILCESNPAFSVLPHETVGRMRDIVETCIDSVTQRSDVGPNIAVLLRRIRALAQSGLH